MHKLALHIGTQKTGSTSIQTFFTQNPEILAREGLSYVQAARGPAAHNKIAIQHKTPKFPRFMTRIVREVQGAPEKTHILSSEMLFSPGMARSLAAHLPDDLRAATKVVVYLRRQDRFLEAMYKQVVKTGRFTGTPQEYRQKRDAALCYSRALNAYGEAFGDENMCVRIYDPAHFPGRNVILDIAAQIGLGGIGKEDLPEKFSNITLSREVSEMLGLISRTTDINIAELIRVIIRNEPPGAFESGDAYTAQERREIVDRYAEDNESVRARFRPDLPQLFDTGDLEGDLSAHAVPSEVRLERLQMAQRAVFEAIGQSHKAICEPG